MISGAKSIIIILMSKLNSNFNVQEFNMIIYLFYENY